MKRHEAGLICFSLLLLSSVAWATPTATVPANVMTQITMTAASSHSDPFNDVVLDVVFTDPAGKAIRVPAFWAGGNEWKVRYASPVVGAHRFVSECSDKDDRGLNGVTGEVEVTPYVGSNPLYRHGAIEVSPDHRYVQHHDGTPFFWLGDTWWMGLTRRLVWPDDFARLTADRRQKGFTVVQIVAGLYPDMPAFDERGANEAGFPWEKDYARIRPEYFDAADKKIEYLVDQGIAPCVVGAWGYHLPWLGEEKMKQHQRYVYARWGALPMIWCVAGELNLPFYLSPDFPAHGQKQTESWENVLHYARSINCFGRPISAHPTGVGRLSMRDLLKDQQVLDFDMLQTPHGQMEVIKPTVDAVRLSVGLRPEMPTVNAESSYEMLWDRTPPEVVRRVFWVCWANGVKGYTYGANGIWQLNRNNKPYGNSPWGGGYGKIAWDDAMNLPGSTQVSLGKELMLEFDWQKFEPHPKWATWAEQADSRVAKLRKWIWYPEGEPAVDAPVAARYFRKTFELPEAEQVRSASLVFIADDQCTVWLNGQEIGSSQDWHHLRRENVRERLRPGRNVLAVRAENMRAPVEKNPAGLMCGLRIQLKGSEALELVSDETWKASREDVADWLKPNFDDAAWPAAKIAAPAGGGPWGQLETPDAADAYTVPYAFGIADGVRLVYVPEPKAIVLHELPPRSTMGGFYFDPTDGSRLPRTTPAADDNGDVVIEPPPAAQDWVLTLPHASARPAR